jgi:hypothetical protein
MTQAKQVKQLLWINKIIKLPIAHTLKNDEMQEELSDIICIIS